ncbi:MAG TPA: SDR family NAD(P)-dependent oxidoreductase [Candidatus Acidoferrum sp.]|nr:SDR family NAD(P)-dependent oxidoreductase [Candidatus Acidoferrum sp.]
MNESSVGALAGEAAIVTGGGRGFGKAIARGLAAAGAAVTVTARSRNQLGQTVTEIEAAGGRAIAVAGDVTNRADVARVVAEAEKKFGPTTVLVNNAGVTGPFGPIWTSDPDDWWDAQAVIVRGTLLFMRAVMPGMIARRAGTVINVSALGGQWFAPKLTAYAVAKSSQIRLSEHAAAEAKEFGVSVFSIEPGTVYTDMTERTITSPDAQRWVPQMVEYLKNVIKAKDPGAGLARCAEMCVQLASGRYAALSGRFLLPSDDFDKMLLEPQHEWGSALVPRQPQRTR